MNKKIIISLTAIIVILVIALSITYSYFTAKITENNKTKTVIKSGNLELIFTGETEINAENVLPGQTFTKTFSVENPNDIDMKFNIYLENVTNTFNDDLVYSLKNNEELITDIRKMPSTKDGKTYILYELNILAHEKNNYSLDITFINKDELQITQGCTFEATLGIDNESADKVASKNEHIVSAFKYNNDTSSENYCVNGSEETCEITKCYRNLDSNSCEAGTIILYEINDNQEKAFNVLFDDGETMRIQQIDNTTSNSSWSSTSNSSTANGPYGVLNLLETNTSNWTNVNIKSYSMGTTIFATNKYTGCSSYNICNDNIYNLDKTDVYARLITVQEAVKLGCTETANSCPSWLNNGENIWTMNASSTNFNNAWRIDKNGNLISILSGCDGYYNNNCGSTTFGKAVVEINKL